ncbi:hypothetical protein WJX84_010636 [Apatococcus fuscideae]|uniref:Peptidase A1 domain-containing protein n=1 Tax=Apatococcus fuscideae TaxID=2026836 RepID=A0AAW1SYZ5_9CHLO
MFPTMFCPMLVTRALADSTNATIFISYGTGEVRVAPVNDTLRVGAVSIPRQGIGVAGSVTADYASSSYDGLFGLGFPNNSALNSTPPFFNMIQEGKLQQNVFSVWLNPDLAALDAGEITIGGLNHSRFSGNLTM